MATLWCLYCYSQTGPWWLASDKPNMRKRIAAWRPSHSHGAWECQANGGTQGQCPTPYMFHYRLPLLMSWLASSRQSSWLRVQLQLLAALPLAWERALTLSEGETTALVCEVLPDVSGGASLPSGFLLHTHVSLLWLPYNKLVPIRSPYIRNRLQ